MLVEFALWRMDDTPERAEATSLPHEGQLVRAGFGLAA